MSSVILIPINRRAWCCRCQVLNNLVLIASSSQLNQTFGIRSDDWKAKVILVFVMEHVVLVLKWVFQAAVPGVPAWVVKSVARDAFICRHDEMHRNLTKESRTQRRALSPARGMLSP